MSEVNHQAAAEALEQASEGLLALAQIFRAAAGKGAKSGGDGKAGGKRAAKPAAEEQEEVDEDTVRGKLKELLDAKGKDVMVQALESVGAGKLGDVDASQYAELFAKAQELLDEVEEMPDPAPKKGAKKAAKKAGPTAEEVLEKATELKNADIDALKAVLKVLKVKKISDIAEDDLGTAMEKITEALEAATGGDDDNLL